MSKPPSLRPRIGVERGLLSNPDHPVAKWISNRLAHHADLLTFYGNAASHGAEGEPAVRIDRLWDGLIYRTACHVSTELMSGLVYEPALTLADGETLACPLSRDLFLTRVFTWARFRAMTRDPKGLRRFHQTNKYLLYAFAPLHYRAAGRMAAKTNRETWPQIANSYAHELRQALAQTPTPGRRVNVLLHVLGYFKHDLAVGEKKRLLESIEHYRLDKIPFEEPRHLLAQLAQRFDRGYLREQTFFEPYPCVLVQEFPK